MELTQKQLQGLAELKQTAPMAVRAIEEGTEVQREIYGLTTFDGRVWWAWVTGRGFRVITWEQD